MIPRPTIRKGSALGGALLLSGCTQSTSLRDTFFVATRPLDLAISFLLITVVILAAWWMILRLAKSPPKRLFIATVSVLAFGLALAALPTLMLVTGIVWPSLVAVLQLATFGGGLVLIVIFGTASLFVWHIIAAVIDRL